MSVYSLFCVFAGEEKKNKLINNLCLLSVLYCLQSWKKRTTNKGKHYSTGNNKSTLLNKFTLPTQRLKEDLEDVI